MRADQDMSSYEIKLTIAREECPGLHAALSLIQDPKRRARRLRELAAKGLLLEGHGLAAQSATGMNQASQVPTPSEAMPPAAAKSLADVFDWDTDAT